MLNEAKAKKGLQRDRARFNSAGRCQRFKKPGRHAQEHQRRRDQRQQDVLRHVRVKEIQVARGGEGRDEGDDEGEYPQRPVGECGCDRATVGKAIAKRTDCQQIGAMDGDDAEPDTWIERPRGPPKIKGRKKIVHENELRGEREIEGANV